MNSTIENFLMTACSYSSIEIRTVFPCKDHSQFYIPGRMLDELANHLSFVPPLPTLTIKVDQCNTIVDSAEFQNYLDALATNGQQVRNNCNRRALHEQS